MLAAHLNQGQAPATLVRTYIMKNVRLGDYVMQRETTSHWTEEDLDRKVIVCTHNLTLKQANSVCRSHILKNRLLIYILQGLLWKTQGGAVLNLVQFFTRKMFITIDFE